MKNKNVVTLLTSLVLCFTLAVPTFAQSNTTDSGYVISSKAVDFLKHHKVDLTKFKKSAATTKKLSNGMSASALYDENIRSLEKQVAAYNFSDEQIQQYVDGLVDNTPTIVDTNATTLGVTNPPYSSRVSADGIGYEVKSNPGFYEETAYAIIPSAQRYVGTSGYMFYTVAEGSFGIDVGLWYGSGNDGVGWRAFHMQSGTQTADTGVISGLTAGKNIYTLTKVTSLGAGSNNDYVQMRVVDANNFSIVYSDIYYYAGRTLSIPNTTINRQITLCRSDGIFSDGSYMRNVKFNTAYLYSASGYAPVSSTNTASTRRGAFGSNNTTRQQVTVNSYTQWDSEDISINF